MASTITDHFAVRKGGVKDEHQTSKKLMATQIKDIKPETSTDAKNKDLEELKQFDLNWEYGPCIGITRLERWHRAAKHGLNPPQLIKDLIESHSNNTDYTECLWNGYNI